MARKKGIKKDRHPILEDEFLKIIFLTTNDDTMNKATKLKLLRVYTILYYSGCRISEINDFTLDNINYIIEHKNFVLEDTKTNTTQLLKFNDVGIKAISDLDFSDCKNAIFYKNGSDIPMAHCGLRNLVNKHLEIQLNKLYTTHSFRAGYVTQIVEATGNIGTAQKLARHRSRKTTLAYISSTEKQQNDALDKVFK